MPEKKSPAASDFESALEIGRPPNVKKLFPNSKALIVSGKFIDQAMLNKGQAIAMVRARPSPWPPMEEIVS
jgi:fructose-bisphosphate aldolase class II